MESNQLQPETTAAHEAMLDSVRKRVVTSALIFLVLLFVGGLAVPSEPIVPLALTGETQIAAVGATVAAPDIFARAAVIYDVHDKKFLYEKNATAQLPLASVTKVMLVLAAGRVLAGDDIVTISPEAMRVEGISGLALGEQWKVRDLIDATLVPSSNAGANALALAAGGSDVSVTVDRMNAIAREIGLMHTYYLNPTGLDESTTMGGAYGSAYDMARLFSYIIEKYPSLLDGTARDGQLITSESGITHTTVNTNELLGEIPGLIGGKTGYTDLAGGNLIIAFDAGLGHPVIISVLGSTQEGRFTDMRSLVHFARAALQ